MSDRPPKTPAKHKQHEIKGLIYLIGRALVELLKVRTIMTLGIVGTMIYLAINNQLEGSTVFMSVASSVVTYYFTRKDNHKGE